VHNSSPFTFLKSHFAPAFFLLPAERRRALQKLYSFFRHLDDIVDLQTPEKARGPVAAWRRFFVTLKSQEMEYFHCGKEAAELLSVIKMYDIPIFPFIDFIDKGLEEDLSKRKFETPMDTESYCYGVAGTVGVVCLPIFGVPWQEAKDYAVRLGIGVQWINIVRDVAVDAQLGRIYLPKDHLEKFGITETEILSKQPSRTFIDLIQYETEVAKSHYQRANELMPAAWKEALKPARIMGEIYLKLLAKIEKHHYAVLDQRIHLNFFEKAAIAWNALRS
jgi:phytoene synthase